MLLFAIFPIRLYLRTTAFNSRHENQYVELGMFFLFAALEAGAALLVLFLVPHQGGSFFLTRLAMFGILLGFFILWMYFFACRPARWEFLIRPSLASISAFFAVALGMSSFLLRYLIRIGTCLIISVWPPSCFTCWCLLHSFLFLPSFHFMGFIVAIIPNSHLLLSPSFALGIALCILCFVAITILDLQKIRPIGLNPVCRCLDGRWPLQFSWGNGIDSGAAVCFYPLWPVDSLYGRYLGGSDLVGGGVHLAFCSNERYAE